MFQPKNITKKSFILFLAAALCFMFIPFQTAAWEVSAAGGCSVPNSDPDAKGFYDTVRAFPGWTGNFYLKYSAAKEIYYKRAASGGCENSWIDTSDIHYHISHGAPHWDSFYLRWLTAVTFEGTISNPLTPDQTYLDASEARNSWGDVDLEWIAFRNCSLLDNTSWRYWGRTMNRLHLFLGFKTSSYVANNFGSLWALKMKRFWWWRWWHPWFYYYYFSRTITQAWFSTCDATQPSGVVARVIAEDFINFFDHLHGQGFVSPDPIPNFWKWRWDHKVGPRWWFWWFRPFGTMANGAVQEVSEVNRLEVVPRVVDEVYVREIGAAFGFGPGDEVEDSEEDFFLMSRPTDDNLDPEDPSNPSHLLTVFKDSGIYTYYNTGKMWKLETDALDEPVIPTIYSESNSEPTALQFLTNPSHVNMFPVDAAEVYIGCDTLVKENVDTEERYEYPVLRHVCYMRTVDALPGMPASVAGPGARLTVYLDDTGAVIGAVGNWRQVQPAGMVSVITKEEAWELFILEGMEAAVAALYVEYDDAQTDFGSAVLGYYEHEGTTQQTELIPVWIFDVDFFKEGELVLEGNIYIPAQQ